MIFERNKVKLNIYLVRTIHRFGDVFPTFLVMAKKPEDDEAELQTKLIQLQRVTEKSDQVLNTEKKRVIARHVESLKETISEVNKLRISVEATDIRRFLMKSIAGIMVLKQRWRKLTVKSTY